MIPPLFLWLRVGWFRLPFPLVALWPLLIVLLVLLQVLLIPPVKPGWSLGRRMLLPTRIWRVCATLRGLNVRVQPAPGEGPLVHIVLW